MTNNSYQTDFEVRSPYAPPTANIDNYDEFEECNTEPFYSKTGRIGRLRFLAYSTMLGLCAVVLGGIGTVLLSLESDIVNVIAGLFFVTAFVAMIYVQFAPAMRRFNDLGKSGWYALLLLIPYIALLVWLYLMFKSGDEGVNGYGAPAEPPTTAITVIALVVPVLAVVGIIMAIMFVGQS